MIAVLGIDAAWTSKQPSGIALLRCEKDHWECAGLAPSYGSFITLADGDPVNWYHKPVGSAPDPIQILRAASRILGNGASIQVVAVDMPLATVPIIGRREADNAISKAFGSAKCSVHSPTVDRPGQIGAKLSDGFVKAGFPFATQVTRPPMSPCLIEVYPHPALMTLMHAKERLMYKASKSTKFWPGTPVGERIARLLSIYQSILSALSEHISGIFQLLPLPGHVGTIAELKRYEDALDALVCCWAGIQYLAGRVKPYGDQTAAIWT